MFNKVDKFGKYASKPTFGVLTHFVYDAKLKSTLPHWDRFPLCIPCDPKGSDGFLGWNLHYVPGVIRKAILGELFKHMEYYSKDPRARFQASYKFLKQMSVFDSIRPCIKHYLYAHVKSRYLNINPVNYDQVVKMPTAMWQSGRPYRGAR